MKNWDIFVAGVSILPAVCVQTVGLRCRRDEGATLVGGQVEALALRAADMKLGKSSTEP
jgi:hypothetical protein